MLQGATKDKGHISPNWEFDHDLIDGVALKEVRNIVTRSGVTTELFRPDWVVTGENVQHMVHVSYRGRAVSAWHMHDIQTDHIVPLTGTLRVVLFDDRPESGTRGKLNVFNLSIMRPSILVIPPKLWHGVQNLEASGGSFINYFDQPYNYAEPDEWRLPWDSDQIPYQFER